MTRLTMVVPTYNDLDSLKNLLHLIEEQADAEISYLIVNNGSTVDGIYECLSGFSKYWNAIHLTQNSGFGGGVLAGIDQAKTEWIGWMPGNLKIAPRDVSELVSGLQLKSNQFVKCNRIRKSKTAQTKTFIAGMIQSLLVGKRMFDTGGTPTICPREFVRGIPDLPTDYLIESRILYEAKNKNLEVIRPKIPYGERVYGQSHWQRGLKSEVKLMVAISRDSIRTRRRKSRIAR